MTTILDAAERERALAVEQSFIIQAPAGSGKTSLLTQRFLALLACVERPEQILAITFTRKAAAEMQHRIMAMLEDAAAVGDGRRPEPTHAHERRAHDLATAALRHAMARRWDVLDNPAMLRVQTIDAFCASLVRQMPLLSQMGASVEPAERPELLYQQAARHTLDLLEAGDALALAVRTLLAHLAFKVEQLESLLVDLLGKRDQWIRLLAPLWQDARGDAPLSAPLRGFLQGSLVAAIQASLAAATKHADTLRVLRPFASYAAGHRHDDAGLAVLAAWDGQFTGSAADLPVWRALRVWLLTREGAPRKRLTQAEGFPTAKDGGQPALKEQFQSLLATLPADLIEALVSCAKLPDPVYTEEDFAALNALLVVLKQAALELMLVFSAAGAIDFAEIQGRALLALGDDGEPSDLALALDDQLRHLLVDEFQDTSHAQFHLLERLTAGWSPGDGHTITVVGDPMQSIYRFREADVGLFLKAQQSGIGHLALEPLVLRSNFRSTQAIVDWNNATFARAFPTTSDIATGAVTYAHSVGVKAADTDTAVSVWPYDGRPGERREADDILDILAHTQREGGGSVAILVRTRNDIVDIAHELRQHGLPYRAVEIERLSGRQSIQDMMALTRALLTQADRVHWLALLRAPWCGLTLVDLFALVGAPDAADRTVWEQMNRPAVVATLSADGQQRLAHVHAVFAGLLAENGRLSLRQQVEKAWWQLGGDRLLQGAAQMQDAMTFFALLSALEEQGGLDEARFDDEVQRLFATPEAAAGIVEILTIHKSKGLEFDTVLLPGLGRQPRADDPALLLWEEVTLRQRDDAGLLLAPIRHAETDANPIYRYVSELKQVKARHEAVRLLYVAATRAKRRLHLFAKAKRRADGEVSPLPGSGLELLWPALAAAFTNSAVSEEVEEPRHERTSAWQDLAVPPLRRLTAATLGALPSPPVPAVAPSRGSTTSLPDMASDHHRILGIVAHRLLEEFARQGLAAWSRARLQAQRAPLIHLLTQQGLTGDRHAAVDELIDLLGACLDEQKFRWIFDPAHTLQPEFEVLLLDEGVWRRRRLDLLFQDGEGVHWIIDWKSDHGHFDDAALLRAHGEQLQRYRSAVASLMSGRVRAGVYSLQQRRLVEM